MWTIEGDLPTTWGLANNPAPLPVHKEAGAALSALLLLIVEEQVDRSGYRFIP